MVKRVLRLEIPVQELLEQLKFIDEESKNFDLVINDDTIQIKIHGGISQLNIIDSLIEKIEGIRIKRNEAIILEIPAFEKCVEMDAFAYAKITPVGIPIVNLFNKIVKNGEHVALSINKQELMLRNVEHNMRYVIKKKVGLFLFHRMI